LSRSTRLRSRVHCPEKVVRVNALAGEYFGSNILNEYKYEVPGHEEEGRLENTNNIDGGLLFGAGVAYPPRKGVIRLDLTYSLGLVQIFNAAPRQNTQTGTFSILASYGFQGTAEENASHGRKEKKPKYIYSKRE
jgi:hypothetical protein